MKSVELKQLKRADLLEILVEQGKEIERLEKELKEARKELNNRIISIEEIGSMAEAAFKLNHVYEAVDAAAKQYLENVKERCLRDDNLFDKKAIVFIDEYLQKQEKNNLKKENKVKKKKTTKSSVKKSKKKNVKKN